MNPVLSVHHDALRGQFVHDIVHVHYLVDPVVDPAQGVVDPIHTVLPDEALEARVVHHAGWVLHHQVVDRRHLGRVKRLVFVLHLLSVDVKHAGDVSVVDLAQGEDSEDEFFGQPLPAPLAGGLGFLEHRGADGDFRGSDASDQRLPRGRHRRDDLVRAHVLLEVFHQDIPEPRV
ncbi:hypothetical protein EGW08_016023 [Elysia chlorotica]|uniref:Uncharacterized protein n=1 Tax=Elysia chlorotica TaxID=188477 RepID=A0A3S1BVY8_ELYCH|nr:hypothetical protein EGW08_016023 [Elysia chlorotica]